MKINCFCSILGFLFLLSTILYATTIHVPGDCPTIQEGIGYASQGDTVFVHTGTYYERINFMGNDIVLMGEDRESTVIDGQGGQVVRFDSQEGPDCIITGFTIRNGGNCEYGGGICCWEGSNPTIIDNIVTGNHSSIFGGGIEVNGSSAIVESNIVIHNTTAGWGGGIAYNGSHTLISKNIIMYNTASSGGGAIKIRHSSGVIENNIIAHNSAAVEGGGIGSYFDPPIDEIVNNTFYGNHSPKGSAIQHYPESDAIISNNIFAGHTSGEAVDSNSQEPLSYNLFWENDGGHYGEGIIGEGNIFDEDPLFLGIENDDFHISPGSPCIDAGTEESAPEFDIDHDPRPLGGGFDIGADEAYAEGPLIRLTPSSFTNQTFCGSAIEVDSLLVRSVGTEDLRYIALPGNASWLTLDGDLRGRLTFGDSATVSLDYDIAGLLPGIYEDTITVYSNDPYHRKSFVSVKLELLSPVTIAVSCQDPDVRRGESIEFDVTLENVSDKHHTFDVWLDLYLIGGEPHPKNPQYGPIPMTLGPGGIIEASYSTPPMPWNAPLGGPYSLCLCAGFSPVKITEDCLDFYIIP